MDTGDVAGKPEKVMPGSVAETGGGEAHLGSEGTLRRTPCCWTRCSRVSGHQHPPWSRSRSRSGCSHACEGVLVATAGRQPISLLRGTRPTHHSATGDKGSGTAWPPGGRASRGRNCWRTGERWAARELPRTAWRVPLGSATLVQSHDHSLSPVSSRGCAEELASPCPGAPGRTIVSRPLARREPVGNSG